MRKIKYTFIIILIFISSISYTQTYLEKLTAHRQQYKEEFLQDPNAPLREEDIKFLRFYNIDSAYALKGKFTRTSKAIPFDMATSSGVVKKYVKYGTVTFYLHKKEQKLNIYQSLQLREKNDYKDYLFIPFNDDTNNDETYGGGRYIDMRMGEIEGDNVVIDFNKAYNPYCAYGAGYACPVPPAENKLAIKIEAGEKKFAKDHE